MPHPNEHCIVHPPSVASDNLYVSYLATLVKEVNIVDTQAYSTNAVEYDYEIIIGDLVELGKKYAKK